MLPKSQRLNLKKDFKWIAAGKLIETKFARIYVRLGDNQIPKVGIATSSKVFKKATVRNRAKRLVSAAFESLYSSLPSNINIVALPKKETLEVKSGDVLLDLEAILKENHIIQDI